MEEDSLIRPHTNSKLKRKKIKSDAEVREIMSEQIDYPRYSSESDFKVSPFRSDLNDKYTNSIQNQLIPKQTNFNIQDDYMNKGKIETRVYENMLKTYSGKLSEIQEKLAFMDAQQAFDQNKFLHRVFRM
jgi:hypothetical protein